MKVRFLNPNNIDYLRNELQKIENDPHVASILFFMAYKDHYSNAEVKNVLEKVTKPVIGGIFPELIAFGERKQSGVLLISLDVTLTTQLIDLSLSDEAIFELLEQHQSDSFKTDSSLFVFIDAFSEQKENLITSLFNFFGNNSTYIGGGAGSLCFLKKPCIINNDGIHKNVAIIGWSPKKMTIGVAHGWNSISAPLKITKSSNNKVYSINYLPAFEVYKEIVESHSGKQFTSTNFFEIAKSYPMGITKIDSEKIVRDPFMISDNTIHFIDAINEGSYIEILHGNIDSLLNGAKESKRRAIINTHLPTNELNVFCVDCISRVLYMDDDFEKELAIINNGTKAFGILSIGEIATSDALLEIFNKTIVFALW